MLPIQKREEKSEVALLDAEHGAPRKGSTAGDPLWIGAQGKASGASAFNNLTKAFLGAASFELPWALKQSGIGFGILSLIIFAWTCAYTLKILGRMRVMVMRGNGCSSTFERGCAVTYVEIGRAAYGNAGARLVNFGVVTMSLGVCAAYLVFVGTTLHSVFVNLGVYPIMSIGSSCADATASSTGCIALLNDYSKLAWTSLAQVSHAASHFGAQILHRAGAALAGVGGGALCGERADPGGGPVIFHRVLRVPGSSRPGGEGGADGKRPGNSGCGGHDGVLGARHRLRTLWIGRSGGATWERWKRQT